MGSTTTKKSKGTPDRARVGDDEADQQGAGGGVGVEEEAALEQDVLIVYLVQVNAQALARASTGDSVQVNGASVVARQAGPLGKIPAKQRETVASEGYDNGQLIAKEPPTVRLHK